MVSNFTCCEQGTQRKSQHKHTAFLISSFHNTHSSHLSILMQHKFRDSKYYSTFHNSPQSCFWQFLLDILFRSHRNKCWYQTAKMTFLCWNNLKKVFSSIDFTFCICPILCRIFAGSRCDESLTFWFLVSAFLVKILYIFYCKLLDSIIMKHENKFFEL